MKTADKTQAIQATSAPGGNNHDMVWVLPVRTTRNEADIAAGNAGMPHEYGALHRATVEARTALRDAVLSTAEAAARARSLAEVLDEALSTLANAPRAEPSPTWSDGPRPVAELSRREQEVLALVAEGRSNKAIAEALFVSPNTVKTHVTSLFQKLQVHTRAQLAVMAARQDARVQRSETS